MKIKKKQIHQLISLFLFAIICLNPFDLITVSSEQRYAIAITVFVFYLWITEAVPMPVTSLLLIVVIPLTGIMPLKEVTVSFAHPIIFLFLGGFILGLSIEKWSFHKRIASLL